MKGLTGANTKNYHTLFLVCTFNPIMKAKTMLIRKPTIPRPIRIPLHEIQSALLVAALFKKNMFK